MDIWTDKAKQNIKNTGPEEDPTLESMDQYAPPSNEAYQKIAGFFSAYGSQDNEGVESELSDLVDNMQKSGEIQPGPELSEEEKNLEQQAIELEEEIGDGDVLDRLKEIREEINNAESVEDQMEKLQQEINDEDQIKQEIQEDKAEVVQIIEDKKEETVNEKTAIVSVNPTQVEAGQIQPPVESAQESVVENNPIKEAAGEGEGERAEKVSEEPIAEANADHEEIAAEAESKIVSEVEEIIAPESISEEAAERAPGILNEKGVSGAKAEEGPVVAEPGPAAPEKKEPEVAASEEKAPESSESEAESVSVPETEELEAAPAIAAIKQNVERAEAGKENITRDLQQIRRTMMPIITMRYVPIVTPAFYMGRWNGFLSGMTYMVSGYALSALYTGVSMVAGMGGYGGYRPQGAASYAFSPVMGFGYNLGYMGGMSIITTLGLTNVLDGSFDGRIPPEFERERSEVGRSAAGRKGSKKNPPDLGNRKDIPLDWAYPLSTPPRNKDGELIQPDLNIFIDSSAPESSGSGDRESVHAFLGLRYSTVNPETRKLQRMSIRFGFGPSGSTENDASAAPSVSKDEGVVAGKLIDERKTSFSSAKKYDITYPELNSILRDSRYYADRGYSVYKRNSVTFVKDMLNFVDVDIDETIFGSSEAAKEAVKEATSEKNEASSEKKEEKEIEVVAAGSESEAEKENSSEETPVIIVAGESASAAGAGKEAASSSEKKESSKEEVVIPVADEDKDKTSVKEIVVSAEEQKKAEEKVNQQQSVEPELAPDAPVLQENPENDSEIKQVAEPRVVALVEREEAPAKEEAPKEELRAEEPKAEEPVNAGQAAGEPETQVVVVPVGEPKKKVSASAPESAEPVKIKATVIKDAAKKPASVNNAKKAASASPVKAVVPEVKKAPLKKVTVRGELGKVGRIQGTVYQIGKIKNRLKNEISVTAGGVTVKIPAITYRAYLHIYKNAAEAVKNYHRYSELSAKGKTRSKDESAEFFNLLKVHAQAEAFGEKESGRLIRQMNTGYTEKNVKLAFLLSRQESKGAEGAQINEKDTFAGISQELIFASIFGEMKQKFMKTGISGGLSQEAFEALNGKVVNPDSEKGFKEWVSNFMTKAALANSAGMMTIIKAISESLPVPMRNENNVAEVLYDSLSKTFLAHAFDNDNREKAVFAKKYLTAYIFPHMIADGEINVFKALIGRMIAQVLAEEGT